MKKLVIIIEQEKCTPNGILIKTDMVGDKELWKEIVKRVLKDLLDNK